MCFVAFHGCHKLFPKLQQIWSKIESDGDSEKVVWIFHKIFIIFHAQTRCSIASRLHCETTARLVLRGRLDVMLTGMNWDRYSRLCSDPCLSRRDDAFLHLVLVLKEPDIFNQLMYHGFVLHLINTLYHLWHMWVEFSAFLLPSRGNMFWWTNYVEQKRLVRLDRLVRAVFRERCFIRWIESCESNYSTWR